MRVVCLDFGSFIDYTIQLANELSKTETVKLMLPEHSINEHINHVDKNVLLTLFKLPRVYQGSNVFMLFKIITEINNFQPDIIHLQGGHLQYCFALPFLRKYPLITTFHDPKPHRGEESLLLRFTQCWTREFSDQIIVHGRKLKEIMVKEYNLPSEMMHVIPIGEHGVAPFKKYERKDLREDGNLVLFFGRIFKYKGLEYLIKAEPLITKEVPNAKIIIAGKGEDFKKYERMMINRNNFIIYNHYISYEKGAGLFQRCSIVALPYIDASQSGVVPSAYGFKKPVVATNVGAIPEIVDDGVTGFIVPPKDVNALAEAIVKLLKDEKIRKKMGENAYKKLKTDLSWDKIAEKTIEVYKKAIRDKSCK